MLRISGRHISKYFRPNLRKEETLIHALCVLPMVGVDIAGALAFLLLLPPPHPPREMECFVRLVRGSFPVAASFALPSGRQQPMGTMVSLVCFPYCEC